MKKGLFVITIVLLFIYSCKNNDLNPSLKPPFLKTIFVGNSVHQNKFTEFFYTENRLSGMIIYENVTPAIQIQYNSMGLPSEINYNGDEVFTIFYLGNRKIDKIVSSRISKPLIFSYDKNLKYFKTFREGIENDYIKYYYNAPDNIYKMEVYQDNLLMENYSANYTFDLNRNPLNLKCDALMVMAQLGYFSGVGLKATCFYNYNNIACIENMGTGSRINFEYDYNDENLPSVAYVNEDSLIYTQYMFVYE